MFGANAVQRCGANDDPAVAAAEIVKRVGFLDRGELEHFIDHFDWRWHERYFFAEVDGLRECVSDGHQTKYQRYHQPFHSGES